MSCPTCSHTMHHLGVIEGRVHYHCPRCGTHRISCGWTETGPVYHDTVPFLVTRCREFFRLLPSADPPPGAGSTEWPYAVHWNRLGIGESINPPEDRS